MPSSTALCRSALIACSLVGCAEPPATEAHRGLTQAIVGGTVDLSLPAVGWISKPDLSEHVCSATLIDPRWVLTAAHCVVDEALEQGDFHVLAADMSEAGRFRFSEVVPHPRYDRNATALIFHDLALLHLDTAVPAELATPLDIVTPAALGSEGLDAWFGTDISVMGSGAADPELATDAVTRRASVRLASIERTTFTTLGAAAGTCFGDSGGPALAVLGDKTFVIGVHSTVFSARCDRDTSHTRVDRFADWILSRSGKSFPSCAAEQRCACAESCQSDGVCDDDLCGTELCGAVIACVAACDIPPCTLACADQASPDAIDQANGLAKCHGERCASGTDTGDPAAAYRECAARECPAELAACDGIPNDVDAGSAPADAGAVPDQDAGSQPDAGQAPDAGPTSERPVGETVGSCQLAPSSRGLVWPALAACVLLLLRRRRRIATGSRFG
jgi:hypothetical protein